MFRKLKSHIMGLLRFGLQKYNVFNVTRDSIIHETAIISGAVITGRVLIGEGCKITNGVQIFGDSSVTLGKYTSLNGPNMDIVCKFNPVTIGSFTSIARNVSIQEYNHRIDLPTTYHIHYNLFDKDIYRDDYSKGPIVIGNDVWVGTHSIILTGARIGDGAVIAANSVVLDDVPPYAIFGGSPAKLIGYRFTPEIVAAFMELKWWEWSMEKIRANRAFFSSPPKIEDFANVK